MQRYSDCPQILREFLTYHETIKGQSQRTIAEYYLDLRMFLRFIKLMRNEMPIDTRLEDIPIKDVNLAFVGSVTTSEVFDFLSYLANDRTQNPDSPAPEYGISPASRARKLSSLKSFYKYLTVRTKQLEEKVTGGGGQAHGGGHAGEENNDAQQCFAEVAKNQAGDLNQQRGLVVVAHMQGGGGGAQEGQTAVDQEQARDGNNAGTGDKRHGFPCRAVLYSRGDRADRIQGRGAGIQRY